MSFVLPGYNAGIYLDPNLVANASSFEDFKAVVAEGASGLNDTGFVHEDLEATAHVALWKREDLHFSRETPDVDADSIKHEFQFVDSYGNIYNPLFQAESGLGVQEAYSGERLFTRIVTLSHVNKVSGMASAQKKQVRVLGSTDPLKSNREAVMRVHLFKRAVQMVYSRSLASNSKLRFSGLLEQFFVRNASAAFSLEPESLDPSFYIDKRATALTRADVENGANGVFDDGWGQMNRVYMDSATSQGFQGHVQTNYQTERTDLDAKGRPDGMYVGVPVKGVIAQSGQVDFLVDNSISPVYCKADPFDEATRKGKVLAVNSGAPAKPAQPTLVDNAGPVAGSKWEAVDAPVATIKYKIQAENDYGLSEPSTVSAASSIAATGSVDVSWNTSADAHSYHILRNSDQNPDRYFRIGEVKNTGGAITYVDLNHQIPGTGVAVGIEMLTPKSKSNRVRTDADDNAVRWARLEGLRTDPLGKVGDFQWELILERCAPELVQADRMRVWFNLPSRFYKSR